MLAATLFHMRTGKIVDRRDFFWEDLPEFLSETLNEQADEADTAGAPSFAVSSQRMGSARITDEANPTLEPNPTISAPEGSDSEAIPVIQHASITALGGAFSPAEFFSALLKQLYLDQSYIPRSILA